MAFYRLGNVIDAIAGGAQSQALGFNSVLNRQESDGSADVPFVEEAEVLQVYGAGVQVLVGGASLFADGATDEPFQAGQMVYVSQTQNGGYIVHGSVKS